MQHSIDRLRVALVELDGKPRPAMAHAACLAEVTQLRGWLAHEMKTDGR